MSQTGIMSFLVAVGCHAIVLFGFKFPPQRSSSNDKTYLEVSLAISNPLKERSFEDPASPAPLAQPEEPPIGTKPEPALIPPNPEPLPPPEPPPVISQPASTIEKPAPLAEPKSVERQASVLSAENSNAFAPSPSEATQTPNPEIGTGAQNDVNSNIPYKTIEQPYYRKRGKPEYPAEAKQLKQEGVVVLALFINERGGLDKIEVVQSSGFPLLDQAAIAAERRSRFRPAFLDGEPIACKAEVPYRFVLPK